MDEGMGGCLTLGGDWGNLEGRKEDSSFSEEKEAKRLLHWARPRLGARATNRQKSFWFFFFRKRTP
jgi:hypothetical protein